MKKFEYFKVNSIEELNKAYHMFEDRWYYPLESEIYLFNEGCRYIISDSIGIFLNGYITNRYTEIPSPVRNINNLNKLI